MQSKRITQLNFIFLLIMCNVWCMSGEPDLVLTEDKIKEICEKLDKKFINDNEVCQKEFSLINTERKVELSLISDIIDQCESKIPKCYYSDAIIIINLNVKNVDDTFKQYYSLVHDLSTTFVERDTFPSFLIDVFTGIINEKPQENGNGANKKVNVVWTSLETIKLIKSLKIQAWSNTDIGYLFKYANETAYFIKKCKSTWTFYDVFKINNILNIKQTDDSGLKLFYQMIKLAVDGRFKGRTFVDLIYNSIQSKRIENLHYSLSTIHIILLKYNTNGSGIRLISNSFDDLYNAILPLYFLMDSNRNIDDMNISINFMVALIKKSNIQIKNIKILINKSIEAGLNFDDISNFLNVVLEKGIQFNKIINILDWLSDLQIMFKIYQKNIWTLFFECDKIELSCRKFFDNNHDLIDKFLVYYGIIYCENVKDSNLENDLKCALDFSDNIRQKKENDNGNVNTTEYFDRLSQLFKDKHIYADKWDQENVFNILKLAFTANVYDVIKAGCILKHFSKEILQKFSIKDIFSKYGQIAEDKFNKDYEELFILMNKLINEINYKDDLNFYLSRGEAKKIPLFIINCLYTSSIKSWLSFEESVSGDCSFDKAFDLYQKHEYNSDINNLVDQFNYYYTKTKWSCTEFNNWLILTIPLKFSKKHEFIFKTLKKFDSSRNNLKTAIDKIKFINIYKPGSLIRVMTDDSYFDEIFSKNNEDSIINDMNDSFNRIKNSALSKYHSGKRNVISKLSKLTK